MMGAGSPMMKDGLGIMQYTFKKNMTAAKFSMYSADADLLIVPEKGTLLITTEMGKLRVPPQEVVVVPRGIKFSVDVEDGEARGWCSEVFKGHFVVPDLGPIGANGLANERDFSAPVAAYTDEEEAWTVLVRFNGKTFSHPMDHCPYDIVAWHGNYYPFKYDLTRFNTIGSISYDHPDPSIFTVMTV